MECNKKQSERHQEQYYEHRNRLLDDFVDHVSILKHPLRWLAFQRVTCRPLEFVRFMVPMLRGCFHVACYTVYRAKNRATAPVGAAKPNSRLIDNDYLDVSRVEAWEYAFKTPNRLSREVDDETHRDRFWLRCLHEIGFIGRRPFAGQR